MNDIAITVQGLSKRYRLGAARGPYKTVRESLTAAVTLPFRTFGAKANGTPPPASTEFWALKDVNFKVNRGEVVGIIGRNGAGKSTLLKVLSRITDPTAGEVDIVGRVGSLLEVGTGFHPELTGRENIFLNGAILGMRRGEIQKKFDEIVAFSETERFLDTPVKHYSSGMYMRLAFAVAAHLEPEILIVDEVLAVGDAAFQKKCLGKMQDVAHHGRTVLFVSHNMSAMQSLCSRCIVLQGGRVHTDADPATAVGAYLREASVSATFTRPAQPLGRPTITAGSVRVADASAEPKMRFDFEVTSAEPAEFSFDLRLYDGLNTCIGMAALGSFDPRQLVRAGRGITRIAIDLSVGRLATGAYTVGADLNIPYREYLDRADGCLTFEVTRPPTEGRWLVLQQNWMQGAYEIPADLVSVDVSNATVAADSLAGDANER